MKFAGIRFEEFRSHSATSQVALIATLTLLCLAAGCGGGAAQPPPPISVAISPAASTVNQGGTQTFTATVTETNNRAVTWSVQEGVTGGSITSAGAYTAPQAAGTFHVIATSQADNSKSATATVTVPAVAVAVSPNAATVLKGAMSPFAAMVTGTINVAVSWGVQEGAAGGTITSAGVYTAPQAAGTFHVIATSQADSTKSATATIAVPPVSVAISPSSDTLGPKSLRTFAATVGGTNNTAVTWSIQEGAAGGAIDANGDYVAPTTQGTFHVVVISAADPSTSATATVTVVQSGFLTTGGMTTPRAEHTATLLNTGKVLVAGGTTGMGCAFQSDCATTIAELFDPATGTFTATGGMSAARVAHTATLLQNGKVLMAGGFVGFDACCGSINGALQSTEIYDPSTATFTPTGGMTTARQSHTATLLQNGKVLVAGGSGPDAFDTPTSSAELYDPASGSFSPTGSMTTARSSHTATLLPNGTVLIAGGFDANNAFTSAEIYDPSTATFTPTSGMTTAHSNHTATLLQDGKVLIAGGSGTFPLSSAELYDPASGTFSSTGSMITARSSHTATLLPNGTVLIAGGFDANNALTSAEIYDHVAGTFTPTGGMETARSGHTATLLPNGSVVVTGGINATLTEIASAEIHR